MSQNGLGELLAKFRDNRKTWKIIFFAVLAVLLVLNVPFVTHHPHFGLDKYPGFFAGFGLVVGLGMVIVMKKIIQPFIARKEDYYGD
ncbi:hypothetical protein GKC30_04580 [Pseudodesulfovibrio sp. F-1]|uniref:Uncharacterized protein n=1 Tax=Pseudodesulfovibrio alkaliphilus TaxID=2661613 RepID=A0A7K1KLE5_9BACT|nr:hypothetical protein [Pseudodesulfovibrio alkaliphilus]MUM76906.1 hypothetical protein [Pseudodesulfovibrio alkaliphilus]